MFIFWYKIEVIGPNFLAVHSSLILPRLHILHSFQVVLSVYFALTILSVIVKITLPLYLFCVFARVFFSSPFGPSGFLHFTLKYSGIINYRKSIKVRARPRVIAPNYSTPCQHTTQID